MSKKKIGSNMNADNLLATELDNDEQNNKGNISILESAQEDLFTANPVLTAINQVADKEQEVTKPELKKPPPTKQYIELPKQATQKQFNMHKYLYVVFSSNIVY